VRAAWVEAWVEREAAVVMYSDSCAAAYSGYRVRIYLIHALPRRAGKGGLLAASQRLHPDDHGNKWRRCSV
jgi:hypothetical protein